MKISLTSNYLVLNDPTYDAFLAQRWQTAVMLGASVSTVGGISTFSMSDANVDFVTLQDLEAVVAAGGEVYDMPAFLTITDSTLSNRVCDDIPDRVASVDEDGNETIRTWGEYRNAVNEIKQDSSGLWWLSSNPFGRRLKGSDLLRCHNTRGVNFATVADFRNAFPAPNPE